MDIELIEQYINQWLDTLDDTPDYWDGVNVSDRGMAKSFLVNGRVETISFLDWLKDKHPPNKSLHANTNLDEKSTEPDQQS